jgi:hypothetical protein
VTTRGSDFAFPGNQAYTIEVWVKPRDLTGYARLVSTESTPAATSGWYLTAGQQGQGLTLGVDVAGSPVRIGDWTSGSLSLNVFHHVVFTYDDATIVGWVDGQQIASRAQPTAAAASGPLTWGCRIIGSGPVNCLDGVLDEAAVYDHVLEAARVKAHYQAVH